MGRKKLIQADQLPSAPGTIETTDATPEQEDQVRREADQEKKAKLDYRSLLADVEALSQMTDTQAWKKFWAALGAMKTTSASEVLLAEQTREIIRFQEGVKLVNVIMDRVEAPVKALTHFCNSMPLFASEFKTRAAWNAALGQVEWKRG